MSQINQLINQAKEWVGYNENDGSHKIIIDTYNSQKILPRSYKVKYNDAWCATFISALAIKCNITDIIPTECSCQKMIELMKKKGIWVENENRKPKVGDIIFYDWQDDGVGDNLGWADHVGIVEKVTDSSIIVIEGNISNKVGRRTLQINAKFIRGYACPHYKDDIHEETYMLVIPCHIYMNAKNALNHKYSVGKYSEGTYFVFRKVNGMLNITRKKGVPGAWINPADNKVSEIRYYKRYAGHSNSIVDALNAIGVNFHFSYRAKIANANGIKTYIGLPHQNTKMLNLLKKGLLIKI